MPEVLSEFSREASSLDGVELIEAPRFQRSGSGGEMVRIEVRFDSGNPKVDRKGLSDAIEHYFQGEARVLWDAGRVFVEIPSDVSTEVRESFSAAANRFGAISVRRSGQLSIFD